jgi:hypothetical protein
VHGHHTEQVPPGARIVKAVFPAGNQLRAQCRQAGDLRRQVVGLDVDVVARRVIDRLTTVNRPGCGVDQAVNCSSPGAG